MKPAHGLVLIRRFAIAQRVTAEREVSVHELRYLALQRSQLRLVAVVARASSIFQQRQIRETGHQCVESFESLRPAVHRANQSELEIASKGFRVRTGLQHVIPGGHTRQPLLNSVPDLRLDEQVVTQASER